MHVKSIWIPTWQSKNNVSWNARIWARCFTQIPANHVICMAFGWESRAFTITWSSWPLDGVERGVSDNKMEQFDWPRGVNWTKGLYVRVQTMKKQRQVSPLGIILEENTTAPNQEVNLKGEIVFWRTMLECKVQGRVWFKDSISLTLLQISPYVLELWITI